VGLQLLPGETAQLAAATQLTCVSTPAAGPVVAVPAAQAALPAVGAAAAAAVVISKVAEPDQGCSSVTIVVHHE
jgi:hypothetical protein